MNTKLNILDRIYVAARLAMGREAIAEFTYQDARGEVTARRVNVDSVTADENENYLWYSYADGVGNGGGLRCFKAQRIAGFRFVRG